MDSSRSLTKPIVARLNTFEGPEVYELEIKLY